MQLLDTALAVPTALVTLLVFSTVVRRLLGVQLGLVRTGLAAIFALAVSPALAAAIGSPEPGGQASGGARILYALLAVCLSMLAAMVVLVIAEVVIPTGSVPGPIELARSWRARWARTRRYVQILRIALRHGLGRFLRGQRHAGLDSSTDRQLLARSLREAFYEAGVTFVKLGQILSTGGDLLPSEFVSELSGLQDNAAPVAWDEVAGVLEVEFGRPVDQVFAGFDREPLAAASIAQVHAHDCSMHKTSWSRFSDRASSTGYAATSTSWHGWRTPSRFGPAGVVPSGYARWPRASP